MKILPCRLCGRPIQVPAKYARATSAVHPDCLDFDRYWDECEKIDPIETHEKTDSSGLGTDSPGHSR